MKIVQIATSPTTDDGNHTLYALGDDGVIYFHKVSYAGKLIGDWDYETVPD